MGFSELKKGCCKRPSLGMSVEWLGWLMVVGITWFPGKLLAFFWTNFGIRLPSSPVHASESCRWREQWSPCLFLSNLWSRSEIFSWLGITVRVSCRTVRGGIRSRLARENAIWKKKGVFLHFVDSSHTNITKQGLTSTALLNMATNFHSETKECETT